MAALDEELQALKVVVVAILEEMDSRDDWKPGSMAMNRAVMKMMAGGATPTSLLVGLWASERHTMLLPVGQAEPGGSLGS